MSWIVLSPTTSDAASKAALVIVGTATGYIAMSAVVNHLDQLDAHS